MVWACVEEGWFACFEKSVVVWGEGKEEVRTTEEDMENAGGGEQECWLEGCNELSEIAARVALSGINSD